MASDDPTLGVWICGALGDIATTTIIGARAIAHGAADTTGLVTELPMFEPLGLAPIGGLRLGGLDISHSTLPERAERLYRESRTLARETLDLVAEDLSGIDGRIVRDPTLGFAATGPGRNSPGLPELVARVRDHLLRFQQDSGADRVVVVNLISAGPSPTVSPLSDSRDGIESIISQDRKDLFSPSACYAYAALSLGLPFVNFTPNPCTAWPGMIALARDRGAPCAGDDGKTGETLLKTVLAPMFAHRNLRVMSWEGVNLLGNDDGRALDDAANREAKLHNKGQVLDSILGYPPHAGVAINYVPSLGDWKTAWDLVHFRGFMDVPMTLQLTWQGCDSVLAAPLVLDLVRLVDLAKRRGESGPQGHLACFFKNPLGIREMDFHHQWGLLCDYVQRGLATVDDPPGRGSIQS